MLRHGEEAHVGLGQRARDRIHPGSRRLHRADHGTLEREVPERPSCTQSRQVVELRTESPLAGGAGAPVCCRKRAIGPGHR